MKILQLRFTNLNALYGNWEIDFTARQFDGIFAITGATGAGKSTILDAICLALYGRTPRLDKISTSSNEIMSRGTGECFSEITFLLAGKKYTAHWSQTRAYKKKDGKLQNPKHEIAQEGDILESLPTKTVKKIEQLLGLDFPRFTRTILLAQGQFSAFLNANAAERGEILEKITGTAIYSKISIAVHERQRQEKEKIEKLRLELGSITLKTPAEMAVLEERKATVGTAIKAEKEKYHHWQGILTTLEKQRDLEKLVAEQMQSLSQKEAEKAAFAPAAARLANHQRAVGGLPLYKQVTQIREKCVATEKEAKRAEERQKTAEIEQEQATAQLEQIQLAENALREKEKIIAPKVMAIKQIEASIATLSVEREKKAAALTGLEKPTLKTTEPLETLLAGKSQRFWQMQLQEAEQTLRAVKEEKEKFLTLTALREKITQFMAEKSAAVIAEETASEQLAEAEKKVQLAEIFTNQCRTIWEQAVLIASLEEQRQHLRPQQPCPLCGATEHPYSQEIALPNPSKSEQDYQQALTDLKAARRQLTTAQTTQISAAEKCVHLSQRLQEMESECERQEKGLPQGLSLPQLENKLTAAMRQREELATMVEKIDAALYQKAEQDFLTTEQEIFKQREALAAIAEDPIMAGRSARQWEEYFIAQKKQLERKKAEAEETHRSTKSQWENAFFAFSDVKNKRANLQADLSSANQELDAFIAQGQLIDEENFLAMLLPDTEVNRLEQHAKQLEQELTSCRTRLQDNQKSLAIIQAQCPTLTVDPVVERENASQRLETLQREIGNVERQIEEQEVFSHKIGEKRAEIEKQNAEFSRWSQLHALIGSADGKKYRNFVQGLTFSALLQHANQQLTKMTPRYLLEHDMEDVLSLNVIDRFQNDERRTAKNLSGGEGFMVSLALALGLAEMSGQNVQLDSLFLDEGFGTLDEEALDNALEMLVSLQESGKLIGVISHVGALKERIATQIHVQAGHHGRGILKGAGVKRGR